MVAPAPFAKRKGRAQAKRVSGVCPGRGRGRSHAHPPPPAYPARCARAPFVHTKGALPASSPRRRESRGERPPRPSEPGFEGLKGFKDGWRPQPLSQSERGAHERSECAGYARGGGRSHAQSPPPPPAYPARCARAPFVRTKGAEGPSSPRKTTVIPAQAGIQRGNARRSCLNRDLKD